MSVIQRIFIRFFFFCKQKTAYEMRISDWSADVCSSDLVDVVAGDLVGAPSAALIGLRGYTEKNLVGIRDQRSTDGGFEAEMVVSARHKLRKALEGCRWIGGDQIDRATSRIPSVQRALRPARDLESLPTETGPPSGRGRCGREGK